MIEIGIRCYNNFPGKPRWFDFREMSLSNFVVGGGRHYNKYDPLEPAYQEDFAYEEGLNTDDVWTIWFNANIQPTNNKIRLVYVSIRGAWYDPAYFAGATGKFPELYLKVNGQPVKYADLPGENWDYGGITFVSYALDITLPSQVTPDFWTAFANTYEIP